MKILLSFLSIFLMVCAEGFSQPSFFRVEGIIHGYEQSPNQGILKKNKPTLFQGTLADANIKVFNNGQRVKQLNTTEQGLFKLDLGFDQLYQLSISKPGYNLYQLMLDTRAFPSHIKEGGFAFTDAEFILNSYKKGEDSTLNRKVGRLYFNPSSQEFMLAKITPEEQGGLFNPPPPPDTPTELLEKAILKNNERLASYQPLASSKGLNISRQDKTTHNRKPSHQPSARGNNEKESKEDSKAETNASISGQFHLSPLLKDLDKSTIQIQEDAIRREREQLLLHKYRAKNRQDSLEIERREQQILFAEKEIANARLLISSQEEKLSAQQHSLVMMISLMVILSISSFFVFTYFKQKEKTSHLIQSKNRQITDSINYARRIQKSIFISEDLLQQHLPESFVFLNPKAIVSGDFYFVSPVAGGKYLVAVADCTGHGVPGAFMSLIGHRLLREIVVEKGIHDPSAVLEKLHTGINESLNQIEDQENSQDGMDVAVCLIDPETYTLIFAGAMNPAYLVYEQELQVLQADVSSVGGKTLRPTGENEKRKFTNKACKYNTGSMLYLFTDGYMDQFGGELDQKFNTKRFKSLLIDIQPLSAAEQKEKVASTLKEWQKETSQTDDILLLGVRLL